MDISKNSGQALLDESVISKSRKSVKVLISQGIYIIFFSILFIGEQFYHDPQFRGPLAKRSCTDVICLMFFFVFLIAFAFAGYYGKCKTKKVNIAKLIRNLLKHNVKGI